MAETLEVKPLSEYIPQEYREKPYLKDLATKPIGAESLAEVFKKLDGAETLIGRKIGIPGDGAKPEEEDKFYDSLRAKKPEDYEFQLGEKPDETFVKELRAAAHDAGLSKRQMAKFVAGLAPGFQARQKAHAAEQEKRDKEFEDLVKQAFTKEPEREKVLARVQEVLKEHTPGPFRAHIDRLDNNALAILTGVINAVLVKYAPEDDLAGGNKGGGNGNETDKAALQKEAMELQGSEAWRDFRHPDHEKTVARVTEIYKHPAFKS